MEAVKQVIIFGRDTIISGFKYVYSDINPSTLTGAIDVVVVEQMDGSFTCGPFHVRFGKMGTLKPADKIVDIHLNGRYLDHLHMKLGSAGEAYFIESVDENEKEVIDMALEVSPFQSDAEDGETRMNTSDRALSSDKLNESLSVSNTRYVNKKRLRRSNRMKSESNIVINETSDSTVCGNCVSDIDENNDNLEEIIREGYNSDGAMENPNKGVIQDMNMKWEWGNFPRRKLTDYNNVTGEIERDNANNKDNFELIHHKHVLDMKESAEVDEISSELEIDQNKKEEKQNKGDKVDKIEKPKEREVYLEELMGQNVTEEMKQKYLYTSIMNESNNKATQHYYQHQQLQLDPGYRSDETNSPTTLSPTYPMISELKLSLCGDLSSGAKMNEEKFFRYLLSYEDFMKEPDEILKNSNLVLLLNGKYFNWNVAAPIILSIIAYQAELPINKVATLKTTYMSRKPKRSTWFRWGRGQDINNDDVNNNDDSRQANNAEVGESGGTGGATAATVTGTGTIDIANNKQPLITRSTESQSTTTSSGTNQGLDYELNKVYLKKIRLSSDEVAALNLREGRNDIKFSMTTKYQGTTYCYASIYRWKWHDKIVISDVDGTITKSDVLGHVLPILGRDWTQAGVAKLYNKIQANNYKFIYLSARAIGQSGVTRSFLQEITQDVSSKLPEGPILLSPTSLFQSLHREVIAKKPEIFKIQCLKDVHSLFPENSQPLYAGFGNRPNDVVAYKAVGIDPRRIFTVNPEGSLKNEYCQKWSTSYGNLSEIAEHFFQFQYSASDRLVSGRRMTLTEHGVENYTDVNFWTQPVNDDIIQDELNEAHEVTKHHSTTTASPANLTKKSL